jgi:hypothetical protein
MRLAGYLPWEVDEDPTQRVRSPFGDFALSAAAIFQRSLS